MLVRVLNNERAASYLQSCQGAIHTQPPGLSDPASRTTMSSIASTSSDIAMSETSISSIRATKVCCYFADFFR